MLPSPLTSFSQVKFLAKNPDLVVAPPSLTGTWRQAAIVALYLRNKLRSDLTLTKVFLLVFPISIVFSFQIFLARPWSTPSRSEAVLLVLALLSGSMMCSALFHGHKKEGVGEYLSVTIMSTLISSMPPQIFLLLLRRALPVPDNRGGTQDGQPRLPPSKFIDVLFTFVCARKAARILVSRVRKVSTAAKFRQTVLPVALKIIG